MLKAERVTKCTVELTLHMAMLTKQILSQTSRVRKRAYLILTRTSGRCPLRARNTIELCGNDGGTAVQPQCACRSKLNLCRRTLLHTSKPAAEATISNDTNCCHSMLAT